MSLNWKKNKVKSASTWLVDNEKEDKLKNELMFLIDGKNKDPAVEIKKAFSSKPAQQQEEILNRVRERPISELIEMERQLGASSSSRVHFSLLLTIFCILFRYFLPF